MLLMNLTPRTFIKLMGLKGLTKHHLPLIVYMDGNANKKKTLLHFSFQACIVNGITTKFSKFAYCSQSINVGRCTMLAAIATHLCNGYNKVFMVSSAQNSFT